MGNAVDHLVVVADTLEQGARWCEAILGVTPGPGGRHPLMGTHNRLLAIGSVAFPRAYLEIIAIDPDAPPPDRPRWFGMDEPALRAAPRLLHWAARTADLDATLQRCAAHGIDAGVALAATRGALAWRIAVRTDGRLLAGGALPTFIEWGAAHPTDAMAPSGVTLESLAVCGVSAVLATELPPGVTVADGAGEPAAPLEAVFATPRGRVVLAAPPLPG